MSMQIINTEASCRNIKALCLKRGFTPKKLMNMLRLESVQCIYKWFSGKSIPNLDNLLLLSFFLEVRLDELVVTNDIARIEGGENDE